MPAGWGALAPLWTSCRRSRRRKAPGWFLTARTMSSVCRGPTSRCPAGQKGVAHRGSSSELGRWQAGLAGAGLARRFPPPRSGKLTRFQRSLRIDRIEAGRGTPSHASAIEPAASPLRHQPSGPAKGCRCGCPRGFQRTARATAWAQPGGGRTFDGRHFRVDRHSTWHPPAARGGSSTSAKEPLRKRASRRARKGHGWLPPTPIACRFGGVRSKRVKRRAGPPWAGRRRQGRPLRLAPPDTQINGRTPRSQLKPGPDRHQAMQLGGHQGDQGLPLVGRGCEAQPGRRLPASPRVASQRRR